MVNSFNFNGLDSSAFSMVVCNGGTDSAPEREYESFEIVGRNGDLTIDKRRYKNATHFYDVIIFENTNIQAAREWLLSPSGYKRLTDSFNEDEFYLAKYEGDFEPVVDKSHKMAKLKLIFNRKPQRFLFEGENEIEFTESGEIENPTQFDALPYIRIYGSGTVQIGSRSITVNQHEQDYVEIDSEIQDAFFGSVNMNKFVSVNEFPILGEGTTGVALGNGITKVVIKPRWWRI